MMKNYELTTQFTCVCLVTAEVNHRLRTCYRGDHHVSSNHDHCKHGKRCDHHDAVNA
ncbi:hypothetical protein Bca101_010522 [Brassica carinata]